MTNKKEYYSLDLKLIKWIGPMILGLIAAGLSPHICGTNNPEFGFFATLGVFYSLYIFRSMMKK